jgi:RNA polymerase-binding transcription factor DksA
MGLLKALKRMILRKDYVQSRDIFSLEKYKHTPDYIVVDELEEYRRIEAILKEKLRELTEVKRRLYTLEAIENCKYCFCPVCGDFLHKETYKIAHPDNMTDIEMSLAGKNLVNCGCDQ